MLIEIMKADSSNAAEIAKVHKETWIATYVNSSITVEDVLALNLDGSERVNRIAKTLANQDGSICTFVAKVDGVVVGFCTAEKEEEAGTIKSLYILPDFHRKGIGKKLLDVGINWLGSDRDVYLSVAMANLNAQGFYAKYGFEDTGDTSQFAIRPGGKTIASWRMRFPAA